MQMHLALVLPLAWTTPAWGGQVEGTLFRDGRPVSGATVELHSAAEVKERVKTDPAGAFRAYLRETGSYEFVLPEHALSYRIYSYPSPVRYDFDMVKQGDGSYLLRRR
jgi:hypothetical protein